MSTHKSESSATIKPLLERRSPIGGTYGLLILIVFFFLLPSAFRAARTSLNNKENDVKDWLPSDFTETAELEWFADGFAGESFVLATWPGCTTDDQRLRLLEKKVLHECDTYDPAVDMSAKDAEHYRKAKAVGKELGLLLAGRQHDGWGGLREKWLATPEGQWYYITPDGRLFRWEGKQNGPSTAKRFFQRKAGSFELKGTFIAAFGDQSDPTQVNPFYNDPSLVCAPLFHTVETGASVADRLAVEGGALWPVGMIDKDRKPVIARRLAMERLSGALFAPAVPGDFAWTPEAFRESISEGQRKTLPDDFDDVVQTALSDVLDENFGGELAGLASATSEKQSRAWYAVFDAIGIEPPPRQTCLLITMTDLAKDNLAHAIGRGVLGGPRGRLLQLAADSGVHPPMPPSMAPPPFDQPEVETIAGLPPLRMGGPPVDNVAIDEEGTITLVRLVGYSIFVGIVLSYLCFSSIKITIMVFIVGGSAAMLSMAFVGWTDGRVDAILMSMPSLVYVLGLSGAIHVINYYRDEVRESGQSGAAARALRHAAIPCSLAALTTAIGLISLYSSNLAPISNFGLYSAIGVMATLAILFSYLPASLQIFVTDANRDESDGDPATDAVESTEGETQESWLSDAWAAAGRWITGHHALVSTACLIVLVVGGVGLLKIKTSVQLLKLFDPNARIIRDYAWLEDNFGKLVPMELVLRVPPSMQAAESSDAANGEAQTSGGDEADSMAPGDLAPGDLARRLTVLERIEAVARINRVVRNTLGEPGMGIVGQAMSADTFLPPLPDVSNGYRLARAKYERDLAAGRDELLTSDYLRIEDTGPYEGSELWRISLRVDALSDVDYGHFISTLRTSVEPVLRAYDARQQVLHQITTTLDGNPRSLGDVGKILVVGRGKPEMSADVAMLVDSDPSTDPTPEEADGSRINTEAIFLSTFHELLQAESIPTAVWLDPLEKEIDLGSEKWKDLIESRDAVIWVGEDENILASLGDAKRLINAREIFEKEVHADLVADRIPTVVGSGGPDSEGLQVVYTGVVPVVYKAQRTLLASLVRSIGMAFILIALVMIVLLNPGRSLVQRFVPANFTNGFIAGMISMIPNVFPVLLIFGIMGHWGRLVDIGTMMTASVAMGVAVDDTIHFLSWFRSYLDKGLDRIEAVVMTYRRVGPAMTQTTIVGGLGLFVFALSTFTPTQRFGTLMLVLLAAALVGDLVLLPALLAGPAGRFFKPRTGTAAELPADLAVNESPHLQLADTSDGSEESDLEVNSPASKQESNSAVVDEDALPHLRIHYPHKSSEPERRVNGG